MNARPGKQFPRLVLLEDVDKGTMRIVSEQVANNPGSKHWIADVKEGREDTALSIVRRSNAYDELLSAVEFALGYLKDGDPIARNAFRLGVLGAQDVAHMRSVLNQALANVKANS